jgi:two-component system, OmpR family, phosphate regulon sensor histidine kinase PhoR
MDAPVQPDTYDSVLAEYIHSGSEETLYRASLLSQSCIESGLGPEDIIALHFDSLDKVTEGATPRERARASSDAQQFLLEVMIAYGVKYREYLEIRLRESLRDAQAQTDLAQQRVLDAERLERERADILATIAHELRTPLTAALGQLDLAARWLTRGDVDRLPPMLGSAREALQRLSRLSADLVEASRGSAPQLNPLLQQLDEVVAHACTWVSSAAQEKGVILESPSAPAPVTVHADPDALLSILGNLLSNAVRYTPSGGHVAVRVGTDGMSSAWVEVKDTGIGMSAEVQARIFEKFYRGSEARAVEAQGLGLGLALVQQLVRAHGGQVTVESAPGQGSTFQVALPIAAREKTEVHDGAGAYSPSDGG